MKSERKQIVHCAMTQFRSCSFPFTELQSIDKINIVVLIVIECRLNLQILQPPIVGHISERNSIKSWKKNKCESFLDLSAEHSFRNSKQMLN